MLAPTLPTSTFFIEYRCFASHGSFSKIPMVIIIIIIIIIIIM